MSIYNENITNRLIDPVFDKQNLRTEWRLTSDTCYLSNWRLLGTGIKSGGTTDLNELLGTLACIQSIHLYDGNELLCQINEASRWNAFKALNSKNDGNISVNRLTSNNNIGYIAQGRVQIASNAPDRDGVQIETAQPVTGGVNTTDSTSAQGWISLKKMLPFLDASLIVPTTLYKKLRLVVNWKNASQLKEVVKDTTVTNLENLLNPILVVDEVNDGELKEQYRREYNGVSFREVEHDRVVMDAVTGLSGSALTKVQNKNWLVNGFNNKTLHNLVVLTTPTDKTTYQDGTNNLEYGNQGSMAQLNLQTQFRINGQNKLMGNGWTGKNQRLDNLVSTFGDFNIFTGQNLCWLDEGENCVDDTDSRVGQLDYTGIEISERINEFQLNLQREAVYQNAQTSQQLLINLYGEVDKAVEVEGDSYNVFYS